MTSHDFSKVDPGGGAAGVGLSLSWDAPGNNPHSCEKQTTPASHFVTCDATPVARDATPVACDASRDDLWDHQVEGISQIEFYLDIGETRIVVKIPTGGGKTLLASEFSLSKG